jgi:hypothetical protein
MATSIRAYFDTVTQQGDTTAKVTGAAIESLESVGTGAVAGALSSQGMLDFPIFGPNAPPLPLDGVFGGIGILVSTFIPSPAPLRRVSDRLLAISAFRVSHRMIKGGGATMAGDDDISSGLASAGIGHERDPILAVASAL